MVCVGVGQGSENSMEEAGTRLGEVSPAIVLSLDIRLVFKAQTENWLEVGEQVARQSRPGRTRALSCRLGGGSWSQ